MISYKRLRLYLNNLQKQLNKSLGLKYPIVIEHSTLQLEKEKKRDLLTKKGMFELNKIPVGFYVPIVDNQVMQNHKILILYKNTKVKYTKDKLLSILFHEIAHACQFEKIYHNNALVYTLFNVFNNTIHEKTAWEIGLQLSMCDDNSYDFYSTLFQEKLQTLYTQNNFRQIIHCMNWLANSEFINITEKGKSLIEYLSYNAETEYPVDTEPLFNEIFELELKT